jgi:polyhydroxyalkanoate synthesis regulator phasin
MVLDGLRGYLQLASGLTDVTRERAIAAARALVAQGEASVGAVVPDSVRAQVSSLTDDLMATSRANRDLLRHLVRGEVEHTVARLGLVSAQDLASAGRRLDRVERRVTDLEAQVVGRATTKTGATTVTTTTKAAAKKAAAKKATAKKATAKKSAARAQPSPVRPPGSGPAPTPAPTPPAAGGTGA